MTDQADLPDFEFPDTGTQRFQRSAFKGHPFVVHCHPRDNPPTRAQVPGHSRQVLESLKSAKALTPSNHPTPD